MAAWAAGIVRFRTTSTSASARRSATGIAGMRSAASTAVARAGTRSAAATISIASSRRAVSRYCRAIAPQPIIPSSPASPQQPPLDDGVDGRMREDVEAVAWGADEDPALAPAPRPDGGRGDLAVPRIPRSDLLGRRREDVEIAVPEHPVLLGDQVEVREATGDGVVGRGRQQVDRVRHVVVFGSVAGDRRRVLARMARELGADELEVVRRVAIGI